MKTLGVQGIFIVCALLLASCASLPFTGYGPAMVVSVSTDGRHAVSSHRNQTVVLWDLKERESQVVGRNANIYSAYFIEGADAFLWQDLKDVVYIQTVEGGVLDSFQHRPTYGHVMSSDFKHYISSDEGWNLYYGRDATLMMSDGISPSFAGSGKLLNLTLSADGRFLLSSGSGLRSVDSKPIEDAPPIKLDQRFSNYGGVVLWDVESQQPVHKLPGNSVKTHATLSPDGRHAVSACENAHGYLWDTQTGERERLANIWGGVWLGGEKGRDDSRLIKPPKEINRDAVLAVKFLSDVHFLHVLTYQHHAPIYRVADPFAISYVDLGQRPRPAVDDYDRNAAIDTAPEANILVTGQSRGNGINLYRFDPEALTLELIWSPRG